MTAKTPNRLIAFTIVVVALFLTAGCGGGDEGGGGGGGSGGGSPGGLLPPTIFPPAGGTTTGGALILQSATVGQFYSVNITGDGGSVPYQWNAPNLPPGLSLTPGTPTAVLFGTPTTDGVYTFQVEYSDSTSAVQTIDFELTVNAAPPAFHFVTQALPNGTRTVPYSETLSITGGTAPYTWQVVGTGLPNGLSLNGTPGQTATLAGTPTATGDFNFTLLCWDSTGDYCTRSYIVTIEQDFLSFTPATLPPATEGGAYDVQLTPKGGTGAGYNFSVTSGSLPAGLNLSTSGQITGTPSAAGMSSFVITLTDSGTGSQTFNQSIDVYASTTPLTIMPAVGGNVVTLPGAQQSKNYQAFIHAAGGTGQGYTWSLVTGSGAMPYGISLTPTGTPMVDLYGAPQYPGAFGFTLRVTDSASNTVTRPFSIQVAPGASPITIQQQGTMVGQIGAPSSESVQLIGGSGSGYIWRVSSGIVPPGMSFGGIFGSNIAGTRWDLTGTPTSLGTYNFTVSVTDSLNQQASRAFTYLVTAPANLTIITHNISDGTVNVPYQQTIEAYGGSQSGFNWSISAGALPPGLNLTSTGTPQTSIWGTPTAVGTYSFTVRVEDSAANWTSSGWTIDILPTPGGIAILTANVPDGAVDAPYSATVTATGGLGSNYSWNVVSGQFPPGLSITNGTPSGTISGSPTTAGTYNFTLEVSDPSSNTDQRPYTIEVHDHTVAVFPKQLPDATVGVSYSELLVATGGQAPHTWSIYEGSLPPGTALNPNTGEISGSPTTEGVYYAEAKVADGNGFHSDQRVRIIVHPATPGSLTILNTDIPRVGPGFSIHEPLIAIGGVPPYSWSYSGPGSMTLYPAGDYASLRGAMNPGAYSFTVTVIDSVSSSFNRVFSGTAVGDLNYFSNVLPAATVGTAYSGAIQPTMGTAPYTWTVIEQQLAPGLSFSNGTVSGTPTQAGSYYIRVQIEDSAGSFVDATFVGDVKAPGTSILIDPSYSVPGRMEPGTAGAFYSKWVHVSNATGPFLWKIVDGSLPRGLALSGTVSTGSVIVQGTPQQSGEFVIKLRCTDMVTGDFIERALLMKLSTPSAQIVTTSLPNPPYNVPYSANVTATSSLSSGLTWMLWSGTMPPGLTLNPFGDPTTMITGTTSATTPHTFSIRAVGPDSVSGVQSFTLTPSGTPSMRFFVPPTDTQAGQVITPPVQIEIRDGTGARITTATNSITLSLDQNPSSSTLSGTLTVNAVAGLATFSNLSLNNAGGAHRLRAVSSGMPDLLSNNFDSLPAPQAGVRLRFVTSPGTEDAGQVFAGNVEVEVLDAGGSRDTTATNSVTLAIEINAGGAVLSGTVTAAASNGLATFSGLSMDRAGVGYTLKATAAGLTSATSEDFAVQNGPAYRLRFIDNPRGFESGIQHDKPIRVAVVDEWENIVPTATHSVTLSGIASTNITITGTPTVSAVNGIATFTDITLNHSTAIVSANFRADASGLLMAQTDLMSVVQPGGGSSSAKRARFIYEPTDVVAGQTLGDLVVELVDEEWRRVWTASNNVSLSFDAVPSGPGPGAQLSGTLSKAAVQGRVTFSGVSINRAGGLFRVRATASGLPGGWSNQQAISRSFVVHPDTASELRFVTQPADVNINTQFASTIGVQVTDGFGNHITTASTTSVQLAAIGNQLGATLQGTSSVATVGGRATFYGLSLDQPAVNLRLRASAGGYTDASSNTFKVIGVPTRLVFSNNVSPGNSAPGTSLSASVRVKDVLGTDVSGYLTVIDLGLETSPPGASIGGGVQNATLTSNCSFSNFNVDTPGGGYRLVATAPGLLPAISNEFSALGPAVELFVSTPLTQEAINENFGFLVRIRDDRGSTMTNATNSVTVSVISSPTGANLTGTLTRNAVAGVVTFNDLQVDIAGTYRLEVTSTGLASDETNSFVTFVDDVPYKLAFQTSPPDTYAGGTFAATVRVLDIEGHLVTNADRDVSLFLMDAPAGVNLNGTATVTTVNGVATFNGLSVTGKALGANLYAGAQGVLGAGSGPFDVLGAPAALEIYNQPRNSLINNSVGSFGVRVVDGTGEWVSTFNTQINLSLTGGTGGASLSNSGPYNTVNGTWGTNGLSVNTAGSAYQIVAMASGLASDTSVVFDVHATPGTPARLSFPSTGFSSYSGQPLSQAFVVNILDGQNSPVGGATNSVTISILSGPAGAGLTGTLTVAAVAGQATFNNVVPDTPGAYVFGFSSTGLSSSSSPSITVLQGWGAAAELRFQFQPQHSLTGATLTVVRVGVYDTAGILVRTSTAQIDMSFAANPGSATLGGTLSRNAVDGVANFDDLSINVDAVGYQLQADSTGLTSVASDLFDVGSPGVPARVGFMTQPPNVVETGTTWPGAVRVAVVDVLGNPVLSATNSVTLAIGSNPGSATLGGTLVQSAVGGVATFVGLSISASAIDYTLVATSSGLMQEESDEFTAGVPGVAVAVEYIGGASDGWENLALYPNYRFRVVDAWGDVATSGPHTINLTLQQGGAALGGTVSLSTSNGEVEFTGLTIDTAGSWNLVADSTGLQQAVTADIQISTGGPTQLVFVWHPTTVRAGDVFFPPIRAEIRDAANNPVDDYRPVTISLASNPGSSVLSGTTVSQSTNGKPTWSTLWLDKAANGYTLQATAPGLSAATSNSFTVVASDPETISWGVQPTTVTVHEPFNPAPQLAAQDRFGNIVANSTGWVEVTFDQNSPDGALGGTRHYPLVQGSALIDQAWVTKVGSGYSLKAVWQGSVTAISNTFDAVAGAPAALVFMEQPAQAAPSTAIAPGIRVLVLDRNGHPVTTTPISVILTLAAGTGTLQGTLSATTSGGIATFGSVSINSAGTGFRLLASATGLVSATSLPFDIAATPRPVVAGTWPRMLRGGMEAVLIGSGFSPTIASNSVTVDGLTATVLAASANELRITVPLNVTQANIVVTVGAVAGFTYNAQFGPQRINLDSAGSQSAGGAAPGMISSDGRYVLFTSSADDLVAGDTNLSSDAFVRDRQNGTTIRVSVDSAGTEANSGSGGYAITPDGQRVWFTSDADNLDINPLRSSGTTWPYYHDLQSSETHVASQSNYTGGSTGHMLVQHVTPDGRFALFENSRVLAYGNTSVSSTDHFQLLDTVSGTIEQIIPTMDGEFATSDLWFQDMTPDGRYILFNAEDGNYTVGDTNGYYDLFVYDRVARQCTRASLAYDGSQPVEDVTGGRISADGRYVAFSTWIAGLVPNDTNNDYDVFVRDLHNETTTRVSVHTTGTQSNGLASLRAISPDGRMVLFSSDAIDLVANDTNGAPDYFVHDRATARTTRVSLTQGGAQANSGTGGAVRMFSRGEFMCFSSASTNLVPNDTNSASDVFVAPIEGTYRPAPQVMNIAQRFIYPGADIDLYGSGFAPAVIDNVVLFNGIAGTVVQAGEGRLTVTVPAGYSVGPVTVISAGRAAPPVRARVLHKLVSSRTDGTQGNGAAANPATDGRGRITVFESVADNLVAGDTNGVSDIFAHDADTGVTERISVGIAGAESNGASFNPSVSGDGRFVAFESNASNLVSGDNNGWRDIFVYDRQKQVMVRVNVDNSFNESNGESRNPYISADGYWVAFESDATNLGITDTNGQTDVYIAWMHILSVYERVSIDSTGGEGNGGSYRPRVSKRADVVVFESDADNLVANDTNSARDVFARVRTAPSTVRVSVATGGTEALGASHGASVSADGKFAAFTSNADNLVASDNNLSTDVFLHEIATGATSRVSVDSAGTEGNDDSDQAELAVDGKIVLFRSNATNLVAGDTNSAPDVFVHHTGGATRRVSVSAGGLQASGTSGAARLTVTGEGAALASSAPNLTPGDTNGQQDAFLVPTR